MNKLLQIFTDLSVSARAALVSLALLVCFSLPASAMPVEFIFDCTISGTGAGTNVCDEGPDIAKLTISQFGNTADGVLALSIQRLFPGPPDGPVDLELQAIHLNFTGLFGDNGNSGIPFVDGPGSNDFNTIQFSRNSSFTPTTIIEVENNSSTALNYKGFDLQLCDSPPGGNGVGLCDVAVTPVDTVFGYLRSGNGFDLFPALFDGLTEDTIHTDEGRSFDDCALLPGHLRAAVKIVEATSGDVGIDEVCGGGGNYGPYYGSREGNTVPVPGTLFLIGLGLLGLGWSRRGI